MSDYESILKTTWGDLPAPKLLPTGSWELRCGKVKFMPPKSADQKAQILFPFEAVEPMADIADEALADLGDDYAKVVEAIFHRMWFETSSDKQKVRLLLLRLGVANVDELTLEQSLKAAENGTAVGYVTTEHFQTKGGEAGVKNVISHFVNKEDA